MTTAVLASFTRRCVVAGLAVTAASTAVSPADNARAQT
ncbi:MAG: group 1 truncated hemoglobin, partial [Mesorhizobium sp.]